MNLVFDIALTHVRTRARQSLVAGAGVAMGVGFSIMMAALMQGSQDDFIEQLVDTLAHIVITDELRATPLQPAELLYAAAEIHGLHARNQRDGLKNPSAILSMLEAWVPGNLSPSVQTNAILRYAGKDVAAAVNGIDPRREPHVSSLEEDIREGSITALLTSSNGLILGDRLAAKLGVKVGATLSIVSASGNRMLGNVVALFHSGIQPTDESTAYVLLRTAQVLSSRTGYVNEIRVRLNDAMAAREIGRRIESQIGYKSISWVEQHEDLLSALQIRNVIMYTVVGAILLVASFGTWNIISTITHEKARDIAILKSLGLGERTVRRIFELEALAVGVVGSLLGFLLGYVLCRVLGSIEFKVTGFTEMERLPLAYEPIHYLVAAAVALGSSFIAGHFPARKAARGNPIDIIRGAT